MKKRARPTPKTILVIDIGGSNIKFLASNQTTARSAVSGRRFTPERMVEHVQSMTEDWEYEAVAIGFPGQVGLGGPSSEPPNLGTGWVGFDYSRAFERPVKIINDAALQALGSYEGGRMLFLGLGTGLGSALIADKTIVPLELGELFFHDGKKLGDCLGKKGLSSTGIIKWRQAVADTANMLSTAFATDYIVLGGGNARKIKEAPPGTRLGNNLNAFRGGFRLWNLDEVQPLDADGVVAERQQKPTEWRLI